MESKLPFCGKYQMNSLSNMSSFSYTVSSNEEIQTINLCRLNKSEFRFDWRLSWQWKFNVNLTSNFITLTNQKKTISGDKITFYSKLLSGIKKKYLFLIKMIQM